MVKPLTKLLSDLKTPQTVFGQARPLMIGRGLSMAATTVIPLILARYLDIDGFGSYKQIFLLATTSHFILQIGMAQSLFFFIPANPEKSGAFVSQSFIFLSILGAIGALLFSLSSSTIASFFNNPQLIEVIPWMAVYLFFITASTPLEPALTSVGKLKWAGFAYILTDVTRAVGLCLPVILGGGLRWLTIGVAISALLRASVTALLFLVGAIPRGKPERKLTRKHLAYALPFGGAVVLGVLHISFHSLFISTMTSPAIYAIYAVGCFQLPVVNLLYTPVSEIMMVRIAKLPQAYASVQAPNLFKEAAGRLALVFVPLSIFMIATASDLIPFLFTEQYLASVAIFMVAALEIPFASLPTDGLIRALGNTKFLVVANVVRLLAAAILVPLGYFAFGLPGTIGGHVASVAINRFLVLRKGTAMLGQSFASLLPLAGLAKAGTVGLLGGGSVLTLRLLLAETDIGRFRRMLLAAALFGTVYVAFLSIIWLKRTKAEAILASDTHHTDLT